ncbi:MAG: hypothetical protein U5L96_03510 [Owenweeksia sp.]|nr:hypothetical protein [Owenweeksia sp.]
MRKIIILSLLLSTIYAQGQDSLGVTKTGQLSYFDIINEVWGYADSSGNEIRSGGC